MVHLQFYCACCSELCTINESQKKAHIIHCKRCLLKPFICSECRWKRGKKYLTNTCVWCQTPGTLQSMHSFNCVEMNLRKAYSLNYLREKNTSIAKLPYLKRAILTNWFRFLESKHFVSCTFFAYSSYEKDLKTNFFHTWLNFQLSQNVTRRDFSALFLNTKISKRFFHILKTITFTRTLVSNLFGKTNCLDLNLTLFSKKMGEVVLQYLLSNFANLFEFLESIY
jgi:hypothetical protein